MPQRVRRAHAQNVGDRGRSRSRRRRGCTAPNPQSCTDDSAAIVREIPGTAALAVDANHVGFARSAGVTHIFCAATVSPTPGSPPQMATPSSRRVGSPPNCATPIGRAGSGRHGRRRRLLGYSSAVRVRARSDDHAAPHRHIHGANLSFAAIAFRAAGGFALVTSDEDVRLVRLLRPTPSPSPGQRTSRSPPRRDDKPEHRAASRAICRRSRVLSKRASADDAPVTTDPRGSINGSGSSARVSQRISIITVALQYL